MSMSGSKIGYNMQNVSSEKLSTYKVAACGVKHSSVLALTPLVKLSLSAHHSRVLARVPTRTRTA